MKSLPLTFVLCLIAVDAPRLFAEDKDTAGVTFFETKIRPVLVERCYKCHSADAETLQGGLRLDSRNGILEGGESGPAIVPGKADESLLL